MAVAGFALAGCGGTALTVRGSTTTTVAATTTTTTMAAAPSLNTLVSILQQYFGQGCAGSCSSTTEPATAFSISADPSLPRWAKWTIDDPNFGTAYGFAETLAGSWQIMAGPGSHQVGCLPGAEVPSNVLSDFGYSCGTPTTTTVPMVAVPDAVALDRSGLTLVQQTIAQAGLQFQETPITSSGACYFTSPLTGQQEWNANAVIGQEPSAGAMVPVGSNVFVDVCAGQVQFP